MNMGGPGDHWYTDLFTWNREAFGEPVDSLLRDIRRLGGDGLLRDGQPLARRLREHWPRWQHVDVRQLQRLAEDLAPVRDDLRAAAETRGWEVDQREAD